MRYFNIGTDTIQGGRDYQDDYLETDEFEDGSILLLLADGMGGYAGGRIASETVIRAFKSTFNYKSKDIKEELLRSLKVANDTLAHKKEIEDKKYKQMGTTLIAVYATPSYIQWVSVGDSPLLLIRDGEIKRINKNHSIAGLLELQYKHGEITKEEMDNAPNKHVLTSAITGDELMSVDSSKKLELKSNDIVILASDGVETLSFDEIKEISLNIPTIAETTQNILKAVIEKNRPNQDNTTVIAIKPKQLKKIDNTKEKPQKVATKPIIDNIDFSMIENKEDKFHKKILTTIIALASLLIVLIGGIIYLKINKEENKIAKHITKQEPHKSIAPKTPKSVVSINRDKNSTKKTLLDIKCEDRLHKYIDTTYEIKMVIFFTNNYTPTLYIKEDCDICSQKEKIFCIKNIFHDNIIDIR